MVNWITMMFVAQTGQLVRWVRSVVAVAYAGASSIVFCIFRAGLPWVSGRALPLVSKQLLDPSVQLGRQPAENVLEVGKRVMPVELGRLQEAHHHHSAFAGQLAAYEHPVAPPQSPRPDLVLDVIVIHGHGAVTQELRERLPWFRL